MQLGATYLGDERCEFTVWASRPSTVALQLLTPTLRTLPMERLADNVWHVVAEGAPPGTRYRYQIDGGDSWPDPASFRQPEGVHGASAVIDPAYTWDERGWQGIPLDEYIIYELHVGTFTPAGTFRAVIDRLEDLKALGVTALEILPIAQFPGEEPTEDPAAYRSWGYDGVYPFAVQNSYGAPQELKDLVQACHQTGLAIILDVVHNHFGPEGNYTAFYGPYLTDVYRTPWGDAINFDDAESHQVRNYFIESALYWLREFHFDALRLDAVHAIYDFGAKHFLQELGERVAELSETVGRKLYLIAESDLNDPRVVRPVDQGGDAMDAQWADDFHHALHALLTGEQNGYYADYGQPADLAKAIQATFVYDWRYSPFRRRYHGAPALDRPPRQFVVCIQNHDQVGNRMLGDRLAALVPFGGLKVAAAAVLLGPHIPLLFMGEEYGEDAPFVYFSSHGDPALVEAIRAGRKREFAAFHAEGEPYPAEAPETFARSKLHWDQRKEGQHAILLRFYQRLIELRKTLPGIQDRSTRCLVAGSLDDAGVVWWRQQTGEAQALCLLNFSRASSTLMLEPLALDAASGEQTPSWQKVLDSADTQWAGKGVTLPEHLARGVDGTGRVPLPPLTMPPLSCALYTLG